MQDNNLVMALLGAGVVFVLVIVVYNQWQIRKARGPQAYQPPADEGVRTDDYLTKPFDLTEVEARARALIRRSHGHERTQLQCGPLHYDGTSGAFTLRGEALALTGRERAVLEVLMLRDGRAVNKAAISEKIFGINESVNADAIEIYVHRLRKKLDGSGVAIVMLRGLGYLLEAVPQAPAAVGR